MEGWGAVCACRSPYTPFSPIVTIMTSHLLCRSIFRRWYVVPLLVLSAAAQAGNAWIDPAIRHTNGMPIASSEPRRTSSVNWTCNPDKIGYCGGYYYRPCIDSIRLGRLQAAANGCYTPAGQRYRSYIGTICPLGEAAGGVEGIEPVGMTPLGQLPNDRAELGAGPGGGRPAR